MVLCINKYVSFWAIYYCGTTVASFGWAVKTTFHKIYGVMFDLNCKIATKLVCTIKKNANTSIYFNDLTFYLGRNDEIKGTKIGLINILIK